MSKIQTARYEQFTRRLLRIVGGSVMPILQNDLSPVLNIEDPADDALLFWRGHRLASGEVITGTSAGDFASASLFNPLGSGSLIVLLSLNIRNTGQRFSLSFSQTRTLTVVTSLSFTDTRASLVSVPKGELGIDQFGAVPANFWAAVGSTVDADIPIHVVLAPGTGLFVTNETANTAQEARFIWLERSAETSELDSA